MIKRTLGFSRIISGKLQTVTCCPRPPVSAGAAGLLSLPSGEGLAGCGPQGPLASCCKPLCSQHTGVPVTVGAHPCAWLCACLCAHPRARPCDCPCARPYARSQGLPTARLPASEALPVFLHSPGWWSHLLAGVSPAHILPHPSTPPASIRRLPLSDLGGSGPPGAHPCSGDRWARGPGAGITQPLRGIRAWCLSCTSALPTSGTRAVDSIKECLGALPPWVHAIRS